MKKLLIILFLSSFALNGQVNLDSLWKGADMSYYDDEQGQTIDSLNSILDSDVDPVKKVRALLDLDQIIYMANPVISYRISLLLIDYYESNLSSSEEIFKKGVAYAYNSFGNDLLDSYQLDSAIVYYTKAADIQKNFEDRRSYAMSVSNIALAHHYNDNEQLSLEYNQQALDIRREVGDSSGIGMSYNNIGLVHDDLGDYRLAAEYYEKSIQIKEQIGDDHGVGISKGLLADLYHDWGKYHLALETFQDALKLRGKFGDQEGIASILRHIGIVYMDQGDNKKALEYINRSLEIAIQLGDEGIEIECYTNIGNIYSGLGNYDKARVYYDKVYALASIVESPSTVGIYFLNAGLSYKKEGNYEDAAKYYERSLEIFDSIQWDYGVAVVSQNLGNVYSDLGDYDAAEKNQVRALRLYQAYEMEQNVGHIVINLAGIIANRADTLPIEEAKVYYQMAIDTIMPVLHSAEKVGAIEAVIATKSVLVANYRRLDDIELASKHCIEMIDLNKGIIQNEFPVLSEKEKEFLFDVLAGDFDGLYAIGLEHQVPKVISESYDNVLLVKGLLLKSSTAMRNSILSSGDSVMIERYYDWILVRKNLAVAYAEGGDIKDLEEQANELEKELVKGSQEFQDIKNVEDLSWTKVRDGLNEDESAIEFVRFSRQKDIRNENEWENLYAALLVKPDSKHPELIRLFAEADLEKILGTFPGNNLSYIEQIYGTKNNTKTQLYDLIWKPMEESLKGVEKVYVSPVGLLHKISFAALAKEQDVYLCDLYDVETKSSTGKIALPDNVAFNENSSMTIFGGVDYNSDSTETELWSYLEGSLTEAEKIKKTLKKREVNYFTAKQASERNFKDIAPKSNILHIATHGYFYPDPEEITEELQEESEQEEDLAFRGGRTGFGVETFVKNKNPLMRSGLALSGANDVWSRTKTDGEDGVLTAAEVATIDMRNTDLVVLSACETGLGDIKGSEGVYGLQRSFKMAGVNYLIMSLWQVPDEETAEFMTTFYKHLTKTNDIKKSFNLTQKEMRKKYDPYFWGAFVLIE